MKQIFLLFALLWAGLVAGQDYGKFNGVYAFSDATQTITCSFKYLGDKKFSFDIDMLLLTDGCTGKIKGTGKMIAPRVGQFTSGNCVMTFDFSVDEVIAFRGFDCQKYHGSTCLFNDTLYLFSDGSGEDEYDPHDEKNFQKGIQSDLEEEEENG